MNHKISASNLAHMLCRDGKKVNGAPFTVRSKATGKDYTFKVSQTPFKDMSFMHVKTERRYLDFHYTGYYRKGKLVRRDKATGQLNEVKTPAGDAAAWLLRMVEAGQFGKLDASVDIFHNGCCLRCGKTLTDSESIEIGFGPVCRNK